MFCWSPDQDAWGYLEMKKEIMEVANAGSMVIAGKFSYPYPDWVNALTIGRDPKGPNHKFGSGSFATLRTGLGPGPVVLSEWSGPVKSQTFCQRGGDRREFHPPIPPNSLLLMCYMHPREGWRVNLQGFLCASRGVCSGSSLADKGMLLSALLPSLAMHWEQLPGGSHWWPSIGNSCKAAASLFDEGRKNHLLPSPVTQWEPLSMGGYPHTLGTAPRCTWPPFTGKVQNK